MKDSLAAVATTVAGVPVTNAGRTLLDIASTASSEVLEEALEDAIRRKLTTISHLRWLAGSRRGKGAKGIGSLRRLIDDVGSQTAVTQSRFETRLFRLLKNARLPLPIKQYEVFDDTGFVARPDFAYPHLRLAIEADSYMFHSGQRTWEKNLERRNRLTASGWQVIHITWRQLHEEPDKVVAIIRAALGPGLF